MAAATNPNPTWHTWTEIPAVVFHRPYLKRTLGVAMIVGSVLFAINHLDAVASGRRRLARAGQGAADVLRSFLRIELGDLDRFPEARART